MKKLTISVAILLSVVLEKDPTDTLESSGSGGSVKVVKVAYNIS